MTADEFIDMLQECPVKTRVLVQLGDEHLADVESIKLTKLSSLTYGLIINPEKNGQSIEA